MKICTGRKGGEGGAESLKTCMPNLSMKIVSIELWRIFIGRVILDQLFDYFSNFEGC